jgi:hypothetical protein
MATPFTFFIKNVKGVARFSPMPGVKPNDQRDSLGCPLNPFPVFIKSGKEALPR